MVAPAEPILGSTLWNAHLMSKRHGATSDTQATPSRLATGFQEVDFALHEGFDYGQVSCISAEPDSNAQDILLGALVTHLLADARSTATVIDSTLSFNIKRLLGILQRTLANESTVQIENLAMAALDRLQIMKVFDFEGLSESVSELRTNLENRESLPSQMGIEAPPPPKGTIGDSEDEEEEMLDVPSPPRDKPKRSPGLSMQQDPVPSPPAYGLLIIDNIAQVSAPLIKNNLAQGQALLTAFVRSLHHLTRTYNLATILMNNAITNYQPSKEETASIFSSCQLRPALGKSFAYLLDVHLLVQTIPKCEQDSKAIYGGDNAGKKAVKAETVDVIEVLQDRYGRRVGRCATLTSPEK